MTEAACKAWSSQCPCYTRLGSCAFCHLLQMNGWGGVATKLPTVALTVLQAQCKLLEVFVLQKDRRLQAGMISPTFLDIDTETCVA